MAKHMDWLWTAQCKVVVDKVTPIGKLKKQKKSQNGHDAIVSTYLNETFLYNKIC